MILQFNVEDKRRPALCLHCRLHETPYFGWDTGTHYLSVSGENAAGGIAIHPADEDYWSEHLAHCDDAQRFRPPVEQALRRAKDFAAEFQRCTGTFVIELYFNGHDVSLAVGRNGDGRKMLVSGTPNALKSIPELLAYAQTVFGASGGEVLLPKDPQQPERDVLAWVLGLR
ncbi:MAG TPA: hypothetical protein PLP17_14825 [Oligoflexia bacterium]|nr:hypothetical protein [Oligoflexia bacterium]